MRILLVEDDEMIGKAICDSLSKRDYTVDWLKDGQSAEMALLSRDVTDQHFSAVILDAGLPKRDGLEVLKNVRSKGVKIPILMLSARGSDEDMKNGLDLGADDYVAKPFSIDVLCARLRAIQRRSVGRAVTTIDYGNVRLDPRSNSVYIHEDRISISHREYTLLHKLLDNAGEVVPREVLSQCIYGWDAEVESNAVEVHVHNLRRKLRVDLIKTIRGVGYIIDLPMLGVQASKREAVVC